MSRKEFDASRMRRMKRVAARHGITVLSPGTSPPLRRFTTAIQQGSPTMVIGVSHLQPIVALVAGILILIMPRLLNYIVALYLIIMGILGLMGMHSLKI